MARKTKISIALILVLLAALVAGAAWGTTAYLNTAAYLAADNGKVAIYRGVPGAVLGMSFSSLERTTDVSVDDLQPGVANRLESGIRVDDLAAAEALVAEYEAEAAARQQPEGGADDTQGAKPNGSDQADQRSGTDHTPTAPAQE